MFVLRKMWEKRSIPITNLQNWLLKIYLSTGPSRPIDKKKAWRSLPKIPILAKLTILPNMESQEPQQYIILPQRVLTLPNWAWQGEIPVLFSNPRNTSQIKPKASPIRNDCRLLEGVWFYLKSINPVENLVGKVKVVIKCWVVKDLYLILMAWVYL